MACRAMPNATSPGSAPTKVLFAFLDRRTEYQIRPILERYGFFILMALFFLPPGNSIGGRIFGPIINAFYSFLVGR